MIKITLLLIIIYLISMIRMLWYTKKIFNDPYIGIDFNDFIKHSIWTYIPMLNTLGAIMTFTLNKQTNE